MLVIPSLRWTGPLVSKRVITSDLNKMVGCIPPSQLIKFSIDAITEEFKLPQETVNPTVDSAVDLKLGVIVTKCTDDDAEYGVDGRWPHKQGDKLIFRFRLCQELHLLFLSRGSNHRHHHILHGNPLSSSLKNMSFRRPPSDSGTTSPTSCSNPLPRTSTPSLMGYWPLRNDPDGFIHHFLSVCTVILFNTHKFFKTFFGFN